MQPKATTHLVHQSPPRNVATDPADAFYSFTVGATATSIDMWSGYTSPDGTVGAPKGKVLIEIEIPASSSSTEGISVRFCRTATTGTTAVNGSFMSQGSRRSFFVDPLKDLFLDAIATSVAIVTLRFRVQGPIADRNRL